MGVMAQPIAGRQSQVRSPAQRDGSPVRVTVRCARGMLLVGLIAARQTSGIPLEMPPNIPQ